MGFNLQQLSTTEASNQGARMELVHPDTRETLRGDDGQPCWLMLLGQESEPYTTAQRRQQNRRLEAAHRRARAKPITAEELDADAMELLIACTIGWGGIEIGDGVLEFTPLNVRRLYADFPWVREQAEAFIADRGHFLPPSKPSLPRS